MGYRVTAPYVTVKVVGEGGVATTLGFYRGSLLPANVDLEAAKLQVRKGLVERFSEPAPEPADRADAKPAAAAPVEPEKAEPAAPAKATKSTAKNG